MRSVPVVPGTVPVVPAAWELGFRAIGKRSVPAVPVVPGTREPVSALLGHDRRMDAVPGTKKPRFTVKNRFPLEKTGRIEISQAFPLVTVILAVPGGSRFFGGSREPFPRFWEPQITNFDFVNYCNRLTQFLPVPGNRWEPLGTAVGSAVPPAYIEAGNRERVVPGTRSEVAS